MRSAKKIGWFGLALGLAVLGAATEARAQQLTRIADVESVGGYTTHNDKVTIWAETRLGRVRGGYVNVERRSHGGAQPLIMTGRLDAATAASLWQGIYNAQPWRYAQVRARSVNTDFPNTIVTYLGRYRQTILANFISNAAVPRGMPMVSNAMVQFMNQAWDVDRLIGDAPLFTYDASGGRMGYHRVITISRSGQINDDQSYPHAGPPSWSKQGTLTADDVNALKALCANWARLPAAFPGDPRLVDGIGIDTAFYIWGVKKSVFAGNPSSRTPEYQRILDKVEMLASRIP